MKVGKNALLLECKECQSLESTAVETRTRSQAIALMEGLGYGGSDEGLLFSINAQMWTNSILLLRYGTS
jgi:hypothetical protein